MAAILYVEAKQAVANSATDDDEIHLATEQVNDEYKEKLNSLLDEFADRFDETDTSPSNMPPVHIKVKEEFKDKVFYRPERRKSPWSNNQLIKMAEKFWKRDGAD